MGPQKSNSYYEAFYEVQGADDCWSAETDVGSRSSRRWADGHSQSKEDRRTRERLRWRRKWQWMERGRRGREGG